MPELPKVEITRRGLSLLVQENPEHPRSVGSLLHPTATFAAFYCVDATTLQRYISSTEVS